MKWIVLGFQSPYPGPGGGTPGYLLETPEGIWLIDCGSGVISQLGKYIHPWKIDGVILSHLHNDHIVDIPILHYALLMAKRTGKRTERMPVYSPSIPSTRAEQLHDEEFTKVMYYDHQPTLPLTKNLMVQFQKTDHPIDCHAMKFTFGDKTICYTADTGLEMDWSFFGEGMDLLVIEGTYLHKDSPKEKRGHLSIREAAQLATRLQAKCCLITHLYPEYDRKEMMKEARDFYQGNLFLAEMGLEVRV
ncbi:MBL fold metallo-hydrolase [Ammoniphilus resinae]|uniref:Ribonuclease BN (tRNA processing enzyme) n=1 Tax=Ammoniphilus resinae TaxID=861532 RepID=A0ABS4GMT1_9BACL|nr:MBL fold metallo-hydrolase [Ammoniphilus resinae]MBP1931573.1 ribonuclease BN (tRNA processing enzyme) [Ammoniphilus resinae]